MFDKKIHFMNYVKGNCKTDNIKIFQELLAEANAQLGFFKLPPSFRKHEDVMKKIAREGIKQLTGESADKV